MVENLMPPKKGITLLLGVNGWIAHQERFTWESSCLFFFNQTHSDAKYAYCFLKQMLWMYCKQISATPF